VKNKKWLIVALVAVLSLVAASCSDDSGAAGVDSAFAQAIVDDVMSDGDAVSGDRAEIECYVSGVVASLGEDRLRALGVSEDNVQDLEDLALEPDEIDKVVDSLFGCIDTRAMVAESIAADATPEQTACLVSTFNEDFLRGIMRSSFVNEDPMELLTQLMGVMETCEIPLGG
jgi:hypothetical protein